MLIQRIIEEVRSMKEFMSIGEFASEIGVSESTLRNWDKSGKLVPHHRTKGGQRVYKDDQAAEFLKPERIVKIQGRKGRDVYYFNYADNSVTDKIGNRIVLSDNIDGVQDILVQDYIDDIFHNLYTRANSVSEGFGVMRNMGDVKWVRMN